MFNLKKFLKVQLPVALIAGGASVGTAMADLSYSFGIAVISANYELITPSLEPNLLSSTPRSYTHKLFAVDFNPNEVQVQRRIRQGWYSDANQTRKCIHSNGNPDASCSWQTWDIDWTYQYSTGTFDGVDVYTSNISIAGDAYANWPLFPADEAAYQENPNFVYYPPKTRYWIETRYYHPTVGWLYDTETVDLWCDGQRAWNHYSGQTTCEGL